MSEENWTFEDIPDDATAGRLYDFCTFVKTKEEAAAYFEKLVEWAMRVGNQTREEATRIQAENVGYFSGYHDQETSRRILELFGVVHPVFGNSVDPSPEEAFRMGQEFAEKLKGQS